jgi:hypothetical protein
MEEIICVACVKVFGHDIIDVRNIVCCNEVIELPVWEV